MGNPWLSLSFVPNCAGLLQFGSGRFGLVCLPVREALMVGALSKLCLTTIKELRLVGGLSLSLPISLTSQGVDVYLSPGLGYLITFALVLFHSLYLASEVL